MVPSAFDEETGTLDAPPGMSPDECEILSVWRGVNAQRCPIVISCWRPDKEELEEIQRTGRVWLVVLGVTMPPVYLDGFSPFRHRDELNTYKELENGG